MKLIDTIAKVTKKDGTVSTTITTETVVIDALCAYRDKLVLSDDWDTEETQATLALIQAKLDEICWQLISR